MTNVFISHTHADAEFVGKLVHDLTTRGLTVWTADQHLEPGDHWANAIKEAIREAANVLIVLSQHTANSEWVRAETAMALSQGNARVVPIFVTKDPDVPFMLRAIQGVDLSNPKAYTNSIDSLAHLLSKDETPPAFYSDAETSTRLFKAKLETLTLEHEKVSLERDAKLRTRILVTTSASIASIAAAVGLFSLSIDPLNDFKIPVSFLIGVIIGFIASIVADSIFKLSKRKEVKK